MICVAMTISQFYLLLPFLLYNVAIFFDLEKAYDTTTKFKS